MRIAQPINVHGIPLTSLGSKIVFSDSSHFVHHSPYAATSFSRKFFHGSYTPKSSDEMEQMYPTFREFRTENPFERKSSWFEMPSARSDLSIVESKFKVRVERGV